MQSSANTVRFSAPLRRAAFSPAEIVEAAKSDEIEAARQAAYRQGFADASDFLNQQLAEQRADVIRLMEQTFKALEGEREEMWRKLGAALPGISVEIARRVLCGLEPDTARVQRVIDEVLSEIAPGTRDIEVILPPADLELIARYDEKYVERFPGLRFVADASLAVGDCRMKSPFGLVDATIATKLQTLSRSLQ
jgi:flagellar biosynthesis/type III secretory pathway protein FliH